MKQVFNHFRLFCRAHTRDASVRHSDLFCTLILYSLALFKQHNCKVIKDLDHLIYIFGHQLWSQMATQKHSCLLGCFIHTKHAFHLVRQVCCTFKGLKRFFSVERGVQVAITNRVTDWNQDFLAFFLDNLISDIGCTPDLTGLGCKVDF